MESFSGRNQKGSSNERMCLGSDKEVQLRETLSSHLLLVLFICQAVSMSKTVAWLLLSPLSLYSWMASTLLTLVLSVPSLVLGALHQSLLLILAVPWCVATICISLLLAGLHVALYLLHVALVLGVVVALALGLRKTSDGDNVRRPDSSQQSRLEALLTETKPRRRGVSQLG